MFICVLVTFYDVVENERRFCVQSPCTQNLGNSVGCMLYDECLIESEAAFIFHSLMTIRSLANNQIIAPYGLVMEFDKVYGAFAISNNYI